MDSPHGGGYSLRGSVPHHSAHAYARLIWRRTQRTPPSVRMYVEVELAEMAWFEPLCLQLDHNEGPKTQMIEQQVDEEVLLTDL